MIHMVIYIMSKCIYLNESKEDECIAKNIRFHLSDPRQIKGTVIAALTEISGASSFNIHQGRSINSTIELVKQATSNLLKFKLKVDEGGA